LNGLFLATKSRFSMRKLYLFICAAMLFSHQVFGQTDGVIVTGAANHGDTRQQGAVLEAKSDNQGVLVPRLTLAQRGNITSPVNSLLIYQTDNSPGYYYYEGGSWHRLIASNAPTTDWGLMGNTGITGSTSPIGSAANNNFLGPINAQPLVFVTENLERMRLSASGNVGIGTVAPQVKLDIVATDAMRLPQGTTFQRPASPQQGYTRFNTESKAIEYYDGTQWVSANMEQTPIGTIAPYGGNVAPAGWFICNGAAISRTTYAELFAVIGTSYGAGDGSTTFNLPDLRGRAAFGVGSSAPFTALGNSGGTISQTPGLSHSLAVDIANINVPLPNHVHTVPGHSHGHSLTTGASNTGSAGAHTHSWGSHWSNDDSGSWTSDNGDGNGNTISDGHFWWGGTAATGNGGNPWAVRTTSTNGSHTHNLGTPWHDTNSSSSQGYPAGNNHQTVRSSDRPRSFNIIQFDAAGDHSHTMNFHAHRHWIKSRPTTSAGAHTHSIPALSVGGTVGLGASGDAAFNSGNPTTNPNISIDPPSTAVTGTVTSTAVNTVNPFQTVNYIIKATNTAAPSIVAVNIPTGTAGQTLYNNGAGWLATSSLYNSGTSVGIGTAAPAGALSIGAGNPFQVSSAGAVTAATGITSSGSITFSGLNTNGLVRTTGTNGILSIGQAGTADIANLAITNAKVNDVAWSKVTGAPAFITGNQTITLTGDVTGSGTTSIATTLANSGVGAGTYRSVTVDAKGRVTAGTNPTTLAGYGITDAAPLSGGGNYIQNTTTQQTANFNVSGTGRVGGNFTIGGTNLITSGSSSTYGAITVQGEKNGWSGINFRLANGNNAKTLMMHPTHSGVYSTADNAWDWYWTNGTLTTGTIPIQNVSVNIASYHHLGTWGAPWNAVNGVLVNGAHYWWGHSPSDRKMKNSISQISATELKALHDDLLAAPLYHYRYNESPMGLDVPHIGMMADEAPQKMQTPDQKSINIIEGFMMSVAALKVMKQEKDELEARVLQLERIIAEKLGTGK
jgi:microcystin-dependent protein